jgi:hypothetical protein
MRLWHRQQDKTVLQRQRHLRLGTGSFWLEGVALPLGMLTLQALPAGALLQLGAAWTTNDASQALLPTWALLVVLIEAYYLARWLLRQPALRGWVLFSTGAAGLATLLLAWYLRLYAGSGPFWEPGWLGALFQDFQVYNARIEAPVALVILLALLWWRALHLGREPIEAEPVARSFKVGFAVLVAALLLIGTVPSAAREALGVQLGLALPVFLFVGLASLSLARLAEIRRGRRAQGGAQADPTRFWLIAMLALSGALVILVFGIEQAFSYQALLGVVSALKPIWDGISAVLGWIAVGLGFLLYGLFSLFDLVLQVLFKKRTAPNQPAQPPPQQGKPLAGKPGAALPTEWLLVGRWVLIALGILLLLVIFIRLYRGFAARRRDEATDEEREDLGAGSILAAQLRALLASLAARFQRKHAAEDEVDAAGHSVRALYRRLLSQAHTQGLGRRAPETPQEFAQRLGPALQAAPSPGGASTVSDPELEMVTSAYEQARYGNYEPSGAQVAALTGDVERLLQRLEQHHTGD